MANQFGEKLRHFLNKHHFLMTSLVVCSFIEEPITSLYFGLKLFQGIRKKMHYYDLNPLELTQSQANSPPVLLLHGNLHNQSAWLPLAEYLHGKKYPGPVFTINLPSHQITVRDKIIIEDKLDEIKDLYKSKNYPYRKVTLIGHSRGACLAFERLFYRKSDKNSYEFSYLEKNDSINKVILMGKSSEDFTELNLLEAKKHNACFFINGRYDPSLSSPEGSEGLLVNSGHLGLLLHPEVLEYCYKNLIARS